MSAPLARVGSLEAGLGINAAPADFVVHEGQAFRVVRTSFDAGAGRVTPTEGVLLDGNGGVDELVPPPSPSLSSSSLPSLAARRRAESLEKSRALGDVSSPSRPLMVQVSGIAAPAPSTITPTEEGVTAMNASFSAPAVMQQGSSSSSGGGGTTSSSSSSSSSSNKEKEGKSPARSPPRGLAARLAMGSQERRKLALQRREAHAAAAASGGATIDSPALALASTTTRPSGPNSVEALRARARSDSQSSYSPATSARTDASDPPDSAEAPDDSSPQSTLSKSYSGPLWTWKDPHGASPLLLFIAHDNPQVGNTVAAQLKTQEGMRLMIESKDEGGGSLTCILLATIAYSGPCEGVEGASIQAQRGSQFIVCSDLTGYRADIKAYPTRTRGDIQEIDFGGLDPSCRVDFANDDARLKAFLRACTGRVDVILDPSHTGSWYPYWEGRRKMAPQFRSRGIGYLRLGDDMSRYGSAFLSTDAGLTFLDDGATSIVAGENDKPGSKKSSTFPGAVGLEGGTRPVLGLSPSLRQATRAATAAGPDRPLAPMVPTSSSSSTTSLGIRGKDGRIRPHSSVTVRAPAAPHDGSDAAVPPELASARARDSDECREALQRLRDAAVGAAVGSAGKASWSDRADLLTRIGQLCSAGGSQGGGVLDHSPNLAVDVINTLTDTLTKQNNPHVLRAALQCLRALAEVPSVLQASAWRGVVVEAVHLLRTPAKAVSEEARDALSLIHISSKGRALSLALLSPVLESLYVGPRGRGSGSGSANTARVVQWLSGVARVELERCQRMVAAGTAVSLGASLSEPGVLGPAGLGGGGLGLGGVDASAVVGRSKALLSHREEATREAALQLCVHCVLLDVLQGYASGAAGASLASTFLASSRSLLLKIKKAEGQQGAAAAPSTGGGSAPSTPTAPTVETLFFRLLSPGLVAVLQEIARASARVGERVLLAAVKALQACTQTISEHVAKKEALSPRGALDAPAPTPAHPGPASPRATLTVPVPTSSPLVAPTTAAAAATDSKGTMGPAVVVSSSSSSSSSSSGGSGGRGGTPPDKPRVLDAASSTASDASTASTATSSTASSTSVSKSPSWPSSSPRAKSSSDSPLPTSPPAQPSHTTAAPAAPTLPDALVNAWYEAKLVVRMVPSTDTAWNALVHGTRTSDDFVARLGAAAKEAGITRGALLRLVLPFEESTSASDQAALSASPRGASLASLYPPSASTGIRSNIGNNDTYFGSGTDAVAGRSLGQATGLGAEPLQRLGEGRVEALREQAVALRRLIRVKMADEGDLQQAVQAMRLLSTFVAEVEAYARATGMTPTEVVRVLD